MREVRNIIKVVHNLVQLCYLVLLCILSGAVLISADSQNNNLKSACLGLANSSLILPNSSLILPKGSAISYATKDPTIGRLGDRMKLCAIAYTIAALYGVDFIYNPFDNFDVFAVHTNHEWCTQQTVRTFEQRKQIQALVPLYLLAADGDKGEHVSCHMAGTATSSTAQENSGLKQNWAGLQEQVTLYEISGLSRNIFIELNKIPELNRISRLSHFLMRYPAIKAELTRMFAPTIALKEWVKPQDGISVAVHIRKGSGPDMPLTFNQRHDVVGSECKPYRAPIRKGVGSDKRFPLKFPPEHYYIDQIVFIAEQLKDRLLYIHIFSDSSEIEELTRSIECAVKERLEKNGLQENNLEGKERLIFSCRAGSNAQVEDILSDLYAMARADCLIRPASHLSEMAQILGNHMIVISPTSSRREGKNLIITEVKVIHRA